MVMVLKITLNSFAIMDLEAIIFIKAYWEIDEVLLLLKEHL